MHFSNYMVALVGSALLATAAPTPTSSDSVVAVVGSPVELQRRACSTIAPAIARVEENYPEASYLPGFVVAQNYGNTGRRDTFAEFTVPSGSYGCQLEAYFPAGAGIGGTGTPQARRVDVFRAQGPLSRSPLGIDISWNHCPAPGALVGSVNFVSDPVNPTRIVINSFTCQANMVFRFRINSESKDAAWVEFNQWNGQGIRMTHNC